MTASEVREKKCACQMTALELLQANLTVQRPLKSLLIVDNGSGWSVAVYGPDAAGVGTEHVTLKATLDQVEKGLVNLRRQSNFETVGGEVITDPEGIVRTLNADKPFRKSPEAT